MNIINDLERIRLIEASVEQCRQMLRDFKEEHKGSEHTGAYVFAAGETWDAIKEGEKHLNELKKTLYN